VTIGARADVPEETAGLDLSQHGEEAYFGSDLGSAAGTGSSLGGSVVLEAFAVEPIAAPLEAQSPNSVTGNVALVASKSF